MDVIILVLITLVIIISLIVTKPEKDSEEQLELNYYVRGCLGKHDWIKKPNNVDDGYYLVCKNCGFLPSNNDFEP